MTWEPTIDLGNVLTTLAMLASVVGIVVALVRWQGRTDAKLERLQDDKVSKLDCRGTHGTTVTAEFCKGQHAPLTVSVERMTEDLSALRSTVQVIATNQDWMREAIKGLHGGVKIANPHPKPLPPDPEPPGYPEAE